MKTWGERLAMLEQIDIYYTIKIKEREERKKITSESAGLKQMLLLFPKLFLLCRTLNRKHIHITSSVFRSLYS